MSLLKRGEVWWSYFYVGGVRHQQSTGTANRRQAEQIELKFKAEINARRHRLVQIDPTLTFGALAARFVASAGPKPHHLDRLKHLLPYFGNVPLVKITKSMAREFRRSRMSEKSIKDATVNRDLAVLRHLLYWATDEGLLLANPLGRLRMERERRTARPVMSVEEEDKLLGAAPRHLAEIVMAALDTGMRRGELLGQQWEHIDFRRQLLSVTRSKTPEGEAREIPLTRRLRDVLVTRCGEQGPVFLYEDQPIKSIKRSWKTALVNAGIRHFRFHDLRHSFNTRLLEAGVMQEVRKALMGHVSGEKVHSTYTHVELPAKRNAIARLEEWVEHERQLIGGNDASQETSSTTTTKPANPASNPRRPKALEKEDSNRGIPRPGGKATARG
ncbi:MAG TPA: tyrosine-type recombinase/integrase [Terriglobales bacterium]